jgi:fermentation-respiration switch protein FrsA (DUF1100 family)
MMKRISSQLNHPNGIRIARNPLQVGIMLLVFGAALFLLGACAQASPTETAISSTSAADFSQLIPAATTLVNQMVNADFAAATQNFDETMANALPQDKLMETWDQLLTQTGDFQQILGTRTDEVQGYQRVFVTSQFAKGVIDILVVFDSQGKVAGLFFQPGESPSTTPQAYNPPEYVDQQAFHEMDVTVGSGEWALPGTLSVPNNGSGPFPAVVLVHGSGPNDRDETIGPNKPFRDLAWGLASQGIAVLRYDKRTLAHADLFSPEILAGLTVDEETVDDALQAVDLLRQTSEIDPQRIYVAGHSLGGMLAPRIGQRDPQLAGLAILAGPTRPLEDLTLEQVIYLSNLGGTPTTQQRANIEALQTQVAVVKDPALLSAAPSSDLPLGVPAAYWEDLRGYQPAEVAKTLAMPMLILQGGRDYQVSPTLDFEGWKTALADKRNVTYRLYPELNHLFIPGVGPATPEEYNIEGHVDKAVIDDIAAWINP